MLNTIVVPLDGSPLAEGTLTYATTLARRSKAAIVVVSAVPHSSFWGRHGDAFEINTWDHAEAYLGGIAARLGASGISAQTHVSNDDPVPAILDAVSHFEADLIVMSTHGRGGMGRMLYGSVADQILQRASVPFLLVPSTVEHSWPDEGPHRILLPLDGSEFASSAVQAAELITETHGSDLTLLRVVQPVPYPLYGDGYTEAPFDVDAEVSTAEQMLIDEAARLRAGGHTVTTGVAVGEPARIIRETAGQRDVDLIVMATHGAGGWSRVILGSTATSTLRHTTVPLLLVRPSAAPQAEPLASPSSEAASSSDAAQSGAVTVEPVIGETRDVRLSTDELELIERSLRALADASGDDDSHAQAARVLAERLHQTPQGEASKPLASR